MVCSLKILLKWQISVDFITFKTPDKIEMRNIQIQNYTCYLQHLQTIEFVNIATMLQITVDKYFQVHMDNFPK